MISYNDAIQTLKKYGQDSILKAETVETAHITGRICAAPVSAPMANQPFDNSAMDGYALRYEDLKDAGPDSPVTLKLAGHIAAGDTASYTLPGPGDCFEIMTGAPVPKGCDAVVPVENAEKIDDTTVRFAAPAKEHANIRFAGEDIQHGQTLIEAGTRLNAGHILLLSTVGVARVSVFKKPVVATIATGFEIIDDLDKDLRPGQIYNSNGPYMNAALPYFGADIMPLGTVGDDELVYTQKLDQAINDGADIIVSTGAVSAGAHDFIHDALTRHGAEIFFHKAKIRPGKPVLFARIPNGPFYIGLPGNPVAAAAGLRFFVYPLIRAMQGLPPETPEQAVLTNEYTKSKTGFTFFLKARRTGADDGTQSVEILPGQQSFMVGPFAHMNCWAFGRANIDEWKRGETIDIYPLFP
jgi:molybdopterin molybdotransferase